MTDCLLVFPYFMGLDPTQKAQRSPFPPLGLMYVAAALREAGFGVELLDCTFMEPSRARELVRATSADVVGIYNMITMTRRAMEMARVAKLEGLPVVMGGPDPSLDPLKYLRSGFVDYVVVGEGERTAVELMRCLLSGKPVREVKGLAYREGGEARYTGWRNPVKDPDLLPFPARDLLDNEMYRQVWEEDHGYALTSVITSRGCPWGCRFCSNPVAPFGRLYNYRTPANVVAEIEEVVHRYRYDTIWFADDVFTVLKKRTLEICRLIEERGLKIRWSCLTRADRVDWETLVAMKRAGCHKIFYGVESGDQKILDAMNRGMRVEQIERAIALTKKAGIMVHTFFQVGFPGETYRTLLATVGFLKRLGPDEFSFTVSYPLPGTELFSRVRAYIREYDEWDEPKENKLLFRSDISEQALRFAIWKASYEYYAYRRAIRGQRAFSVAERVFRALTNLALWAMIPNKDRSVWDGRFLRSTPITPPWEECFIRKQDPAYIKLSSQRS